MTEQETEILKATLANIKLKFDKELDRLVLTIQSGSYAVKADVTDEVKELF